MSKTHGFCVGGPEPLYKVWRSMRQRCRDPGSIKFHLYGGRGITVCGEWSDYPTFRSWALKNGWRRRLVIDRIDTNGNYCPSNCRVVTHIVNNRNKRNARLTMEQASDIRRSCGAGVRNADLARMYAVSPNTICDIKQNRIWL